MKLLDILVPTYVQMLGALSEWLAKAEVQMPGGEADALLSKRLSPDMFPLSTQIRFACVQAQEGMCRLQGRDFPDTIDVLLNEGRNATERPGSIADARARISEALGVVKGLTAEAAQTDPEAPIAHALPNGMIFDLTAKQYARDWTMPQFYFHIIIAYAILRGQGIDLGKADFVAHMFPYLRPGTMPAQ
ncbi:DUF1993 family protein [Novosphingobium sp. Gsoil 351]|uniref:DUF1993 domain-containing protein n=1 Tax=Novosphingobium sp. Gsoil 351 TaxID=2675225 RepID=UPI0012B4E7C2|nr:DUF1993 domain-containing protein [Novosphingobium sp. Gsoil 351]QGN55015.1 DUF1993 family protein [Novosphingobium sp. Gsoil 351]